MRQKFKINKVVQGLCGLTLAILSASSFAGSWANNIPMGGFSNVNIYTPDTVSPAGEIGKTALMVVLHGCGQNNDQFLPANLEDAAEEHGMVIAVPFAENQRDQGCWYWWDPIKNRTHHDFQNLKELTDDMLVDSAYNIDNDQVYLTGLSSGATFAALAGCVLPDVFAGVSPNAGPTIGLGSGGAFTFTPVTAQKFKSDCESYATPSYKDYLQTQITVVAHGSSDALVPKDYNEQNAKGYAELYGASRLTPTNTITDEPGHTATEHVWKRGDDTVMSMLWLEDLGHAWSGGTGATGGWVGAQSINVASYLGQFFADNNLRLNDTPVVDALTAVDNNSSILVSGTASDADGTVENIAIEILALESAPGVPLATPSLIGNFNVAVDANGDFTYSSAVLGDALYKLNVIATDDKGKNSTLASISVRIGDAPPATAPVVSNLVASVDTQCVTVSGDIYDANQNAESVAVTLAGASSSSVTVNVNGADTTFTTAPICALAGGEYTATAVASDDTALDSVAVVESFSIDAGQTGDYNFHITEGHITWGVGYSSCYVTYGTNEFTMYEESAGNGQCKWVDSEDVNCAGEVQACSNVPVNNDPDNDGILSANDNCPVDYNPNQEDSNGDGVGDACTPDPTDCTDHSATNTAHYGAGRATYNFGYYYAVGSGDSLGFAYTTTNLAETSSGQYELGTCAQQ